MGPGRLLTEAWEFVPILALLLIGSLIAVSSGTHRPPAGFGLRELAGNLGKIVLRVMGYVVVLLALQYCIGMRPILGW
jgi:hypothetical protein